MKINSKYIMFVFGVLCFTICHSQSASSFGIFDSDTSYTNVWIDGKLFTINVLSNKSNDRLVNNKAEDFETVFQKTIVIHSNSDEKIAFTTKMSASELSFVKQTGDLSKEGKLYMHWISHGGGSGFDSGTSLVLLEKGQLVVKKIFQCNELAYILFSKNDNDIYILQGIWNFEKHQEDEETHFANHRYKILQYKYERKGFQEVILGTTQNKYSSLDEEKSGVEIMQKIKMEEQTVLPKDLNVGDFKELDPLSGKIE